MDAGKLNSHKTIDHPDPALEYPDHPLVLKFHKGDGRIECYVCGRKFWKWEEIYGCDEPFRCGCGLNAHIVCIGTTPEISTPITSQVDANKPDLSTRIKRRVHKHGLVLHRHQGIGDLKGSRCSLCQNHFEEGDEIYTCETSYRFGNCRFSIDIACSSTKAEMPDLPQRISYPIHDQPNTLVLRRYKGGGLFSSCGVCKNDFAVGDQIYVCETSSHQNCHFRVDIACSSIKALVDFQGHEHLMCFVDRVQADPYGIECSSCGGESGNLMFCCAHGCCYRLHLSCGPLPNSIPYHFAGYDLNLTLKDTHLDGVDPEDSWCDICEEARYPGDCVYRSDDPPFTATPDCLMPQIVAALKGDLGEVKLRSVKGHIPGAVLLPITGQGLAEGECHDPEIQLHFPKIHKIHADSHEPTPRESLADEDVHEVIAEKKIKIYAGEKDDIEKDMFSLLQILESVTDEVSELFKHTEDLDTWRSGDAIPFKFSDGAFELFKDYVAINGAPTMSLLPTWLRTLGECEIVKVGDNFVVKELVNLYRQVVGKHGDFTADSPHSGSSRALCLSEFLQMVHGMQGMKVFEVTDDLLCTWQCYMELIGARGGLNLQFALDNLEKVARVCYALKLINVREEITMNLTEDIQQLERDIEDEKPKLEALRGEYSIAKKKSSFANQCVGEASILHWMDAADLLGLEQED